MLDTPGFNTEGRMNLLNAFYKYFANGAEIETGLEPYKIGRDSLKFRENEFSVLGAVGLVNFHGSCDYSFNCPDTAILKAWLQNVAKCSRRGLTLEQRVAALKYLNQ